MAIDTAVKRRNVSRKMRASSMMGLAPSSGLDAADRINAGRGYIGLVYDNTTPPDPIPVVTSGGGAGQRKKMGIGPR